MSITDGTTLDQTELRKLATKIADYIFYKSGSTYYADAMKSGGTDYESTSFKTALQNAVDAADSVFLEAGTYTSDGVVTRDNNQRVWGMGKATKIEASATNVTIFETTSATSHNYLGDMWLAGFGSGTSSLIYDQQISNSTYRNLILSSAGQYGVVLQTSCHDNLIEGCTAYSNGYSGICLTGGVATALRNKIVNNTCYSNSWHGIQAGESSDYHVISNNVCYSNTMNGIISGNTLTGGIINNNECYGNTESGIFLDAGATYALINGNNCTANTGPGIYLYGAQYCTVTGNICKGNTGATTDGITVNHASTANIYNNIIGNLCQGNGRDGILINTANDNDNIVMGNTCIGNTAYGIREAAALRNFICNNIVKTNTAGQYLITGTSTLGDIRPQAVASLDLSGGATDLTVWGAPKAAILLGYSLLYTEASSADAGVTVEIGRIQDGVALDDNYFDQSTSETSQNLGYMKTFVTADLTQVAIAAGDTVTCGTAGGKVGTGEVLVILNIAYA